MVLVRCRLFPRGDVCSIYSCSEWPQRWVLGRSLGGIVGSNSAGEHGCLSLVSVVCYQVEISASGWSLVQRSPTGCGVYECDRKVSIMRRHWPTRGCCAMGGGVTKFLLLLITSYLCAPFHSPHKFSFFAHVLLDILHIGSWKSLKHFLVAVLPSPSTLQLWVGLGLRLRFRNNIFFTEWGC